MTTPKIRVPEQPSENPFEPSPEAKAGFSGAQPEKPKDAELVQERADVVEHTRQDLDALARRLVLPEGFRQERFAA